MCRIYTIALITLLFVIVTFLLSTSVEWGDLYKPDKPVVDKAQITEIPQLDIQQHEAAHRLSAFLTVVAFGVFGIVAFCLKDNFPKNYFSQLSLLSFALIGVFSAGLSLFFGYKIHQSFFALSRVGYFNVETGSAIDQFLIWEARSLIVSVIFSYLAVIIKLIDKK